MGDFAIAEVVVWPRGLTDGEMRRASDHLINRLGLEPPPPPDCDCDYHSTGWFSGGCQISQAAPAYSACECSMPFLLTCGGDVVSCHDAANPLCASPDMSKASCQLGGGDCDGYSCTDTPNWSNGQHGWSCTGYESQGWCCGQGACPGKEWTLGASYNHPENNCCACA